MAKISSSRLMLGASLAFFLYGAIASMLGTLLPNLSLRHHLSPQQNGNLAFLQALGLVIASVATGPLIDNRGKKTGMVLGLSLVVLALIALPLASTPLMISGSMFLLGLGGGTIVNSANTLVSDLSDEKRASLLSFSHIFFGVGGLFTPFIAANFLAGDAVRLSRLVSGLAVGVLAVMVFIAMPPPAHERRFDLDGARRLPGKGLLMVLALFVFLYVGCEVGFWNWLPKYLMSRGIPQSQALNILALGFASGMLAGRIVASRVLMRLRAPVAALACSVLMLVTMLWALRAGSPAMAWISVFCSGLAMGPVFPSSMAMTGDAFPIMTATCIGFVTTAGWAGIAVSSWIVGAIAGQDVQRLGHALLIFPVFAALMVVIMMMLQPVLVRRRALA